MAANLRSAIGRAARRIVSEDLLILLRGPRPNPAEADMLAKRAADAAKRSWVIPFTWRLIEEQKKMYESRTRKSLVVPFFAAMPCLVLFMSGYETGQHHAKQMYERQEPEGSN
ncbi:unnamed protein product [Urochloa humidicola]